MLLLIEGEKCSLEGTPSLLGCCKYSLPFFSGDYTCVHLIYSLWYLIYTSKLFYNGLRILWGSGYRYMCIFFCLLFSMRISSLCKLKKRSDYPPLPFLSSQTKWKLHVAETVFYHIMPWCLVHSICSVNICWLESPTVML